jgi:alkaline phosphatase
MRIPPQWRALAAFTAATFLASGCSTDGGSASVTNTKPTRIVFFLGDGMGIPVITASRIYAKGEEGSLTLDGFPETAFVRTFSGDSLVTDSAAAMTAYMAGVKVDNDIISMSSDTVYRGSNGTPVTTFLELAKALGWGTGVVSTTRITHATPAACYAHVNDRDEEDEIARQLVPGGAGFNAALREGVDVILGGGRRHFLPNTTSDGSRTDGRDLTAEMVARKYAYVQDRAGLAAVKKGKVLGLFTKSHMAYELDRNADVEPSLAEMTAKAIDVLDDNGKGFFLMVEGGRIDHALHDTNARRALGDTVAFDEAIRTALEKLEALDPGLENTLVVVTADHDHTMTLTGYAKRTGPTTAISPGILGLVKNYVTGADVLDADGMPYTILAFGNGENRVNGNRNTVPALTDDVTAGLDYRQEAAIRMPVGAETHGGTDVVVFAKGKGAEKFHGFLDNTEVFPLLIEAAGF